MSAPRWLARLGLVVATLMVVLAVGEAVTRVVAWRNEQAPNEAVEAWREAHPDEPELEELEGVLAVARKNVRGIFKGAIVRTNRLGLRGPDYEPRGPAGQARIVVAGDSFAFGSGVEEMDTYASRLAPLLDAYRTGERHQIINAGLPGAHIEGVLDRLESAIEAYHPTLYVYGFTMNDIEGPGYVFLREGARNRGLLYWAAKQPSLFLRYLAWQFATIGGRDLPSEHAYPRELQHNYFENPTARDRALAGLNRFAALAEEKGVCGHVLIHTHLMHLDDDHPFSDIYDFVHAAATERGLTVTAPLPYFLDRDPRTLWLNALDSHPNADGHAILAEALANDLVNLPNDCWSR